MLYKDEFVFVVKGGKHSDSYPLFRIMHLEESTMRQGSLERYINIAINDIAINGHSWWRLQTKNGPFSAMLIYHAQEAPASFGLVFIKEAAYFLSLSQVCIFYGPSRNRLERATERRSVLSLRARRTLFLGETRSFSVFRPGPTCRVGLALQTRGVGADGKALRS